MKQTNYEKPKQYFGDAKEFPKGFPYMTTNVKPGDVVRNKGVDYLVEKAGPGQEYFTGDGQMVVAHEVGYTAKEVEQNQKAKWEFTQFPKFQAGIVQVVGRIEQEMKNKVQQFRQEFKPQYTPAYQTAA